MTTGYTHAAQFLADKANEGVARVNWTPPRTYDVIRTRRGLDRILNRCDQPTALDFETTTFTADTGRARIVQVCNAEIWAVIDLDAPGIRKAFFDRAEDLGPWIAFSSGFEWRWFLAQDCRPMLCDVGNLRRARVGGGRFSLADLCLWDLGYAPDKTEQASNWDVEDLTPSQLDYAADDALLTWALWEHWGEETTSRHDEAAELLDALVPGVVEMEEAGMLLDREAHGELVGRWNDTLAKLTEKIRDAIPEDAVENLRSNPQCSDFFGQLFPDEVLRFWPRTPKSGQLQITTDALRTIAAMYQGTPIETTLDALADYRTIAQYLSFFGESLLNKAAMSPDGRVRARFNIGAAKTLRFSCSNPNLQQIPRSRQLLQSDTEATEVRRSFIAPPGSRLISFDYSAIELRVLALLSGDEQLLEDVVFGDLHATVAEYWHGRPIDKKIPADKELRSGAKGVSFGIIYGSGAGGLQITMRVPYEKAEDLLNFWANRYSRAFNFRYQMEAEAKATGFLPMIDGGTIYVGKKADLPKCANYPVQRAAWSVMARAIARHKETLDALRPRLHAPERALMLATVHDAAIDEADERDAEAVREALAHDMTEAYRDFFPDAPIDDLIEGGTGPNWADLD